MKGSEAGRHRPGACATPLDGARAHWDDAPCGLLVTAPDGTILLANRAFTTWIGRPPDDLVGRRRFAELLTPGGRIYHETHFAPMLQMQGTARAIALEFVAGDGRRLPALVNAVLERGTSGTPVEIRTAVFDAADRRGYERELLRAKQQAEESERRARHLARTLQQTLIPAAPPRIPGLDVSAVYRPGGEGEEVGGDFYDVFERGPDDWVVAVGDVRGKGIEAAVVTALARYTVRVAAVQHPSPSQALRMLNAVLLRDGTDRFCTAVLVRLRRRAGTWTATVGAGGHPLPLLSVHGGPVRAVGAYGVVLGILEEPVVEDRSIALRPGEILTLFTDGITEARRGRELFGEHRLTAVLAGVADSADAVTQAVVGEALRFGEGPPDDDVVVVAIRVTEPGVG